MYNDIVCITWTYLRFWDVGCCWWSWSSVHPAMYPPITTTDDRMSAAEAEAVISHQKLNDPLPNPPQIERWMIPDYSDTYRWTFTAVSIKRLPNRNRRTVEYLETTSTDTPITYTTLSINIILFLFFLHYNLLSLYVLTASECVHLCRASSGLFPIWLYAKTTWF